MSKTYELRDLRISKISLVRKSHRPVHQDAVIQIVKAEQENETAMTDTAKTEPSVVERVAKALGMIRPATAEAAPAAPETPAASTEPQTDVAKADAPTDAPTADSEAAAAEGVTKADAATDEAAAEAALTELVTAAVTKAFEARDAAQAETIAKATVTDDHIREIVTTTLEPLAKAIEDFSVAFARQPVTPNVTARIDPNDTGATAVDPAAIRSMDMSTALRALLHGSR